MWLHDSVIIIPHAFLFYDIRKQLQLRTVKLTRKRGITGFLNLEINIVIVLCIFYLTIQDKRYLAFLCRKKCDAVFT